MTRIVNDNVADAQHQLAQRHEEMLARQESKHEVISIIDASASIRRAVKRLIESAELTVPEFASAEEFLLSGRARDSACLILDLRLSGINGLELQEQLLISNPRLPIIFMSAHPDQVSRARALRSGAIEFLEKSFDEKERLFTAIDRFLRLPPSSAVRPVCQVD